MQHSPDYSFSQSPSTEMGHQRPVRAANIVYQSLTITAMVLLLGSLWIF